MPIVARRGLAIASPRSRLLRFERPVIGAGAAAPIGSALAPVDPRQELARLALEVVVRTSEPVDLPPRWCLTSFARELDRTRAQLAPIQSRSALAGSFAREASVVVTASAAGGSSVEEPAPGPVRVAYAIRWLELGDGRPRPSWNAFVAGPVDLVERAIGSLEPHSHDDAPIGAGLASVGPAAASLSAAPAILGLAPTGIEPGDIAT